MIKNAIINYKSMHVNNHLISEVWASGFVVGVDDQIMKLYTENHKSIDIYIGYNQRQFFIPPKSKPHWISSYINQETFKKN